MTQFGDEEISQLRKEEEGKYMLCLYRPITGSKRRIRPKAMRHGKVKVFTREEVALFNLK